VDILDEPKSVWCWRTDHAVYAALGPNDIEGVLGKILNGDFGELLVAKELGTGCIGEEFAVTLDLRRCGDEVGIEFSVVAGCWSGVDSTQR
jgi:hypothetical protein